MRKIIVLTVMTAITLPNLADASCFPSVPLGHYHLGEWSNVDRSWVISDVVGNYNERASSRSELLQQKNQLVRDCETKGKNLIMQGETYFESVKDGLSDKFDSTCHAGPICEEIKEVWLPAETASTDEHIATMRTWYQGNIETCKNHFNGRYNILKNSLCY